MISQLKNVFTVRIKMKMKVVSVPPITSVKEQQNIMDLVLAQVVQWRAHTAHVTTAGFYLSFYMNSKNEVSLIYKAKGGFKNNA